MWRSPRYRAAQFVRGLRPALQPDEARLVRRLLSDSEFQLFAAMDPRESAALDGHGAVAALAPPVLG